jgi:hypothetical protein
MPAISGWSSGMTPQAISVGTTGTPTSSAKETSSSAASALTMPPPATSSGRSAPASRSSALSTWARVAAGWWTGSGWYVSRSKSISVIWTSNGRSSRTGPGRPERIRWNAWANAPGTWAGSITVMASLVTGLAIEAMSTAWKSSLCRRETGAWPVMHRIGIESAQAE